MMTLVCFAVKEEAAPFRKRAAGRADVSILLTGIGRANAEKSARHFLTGITPDMVLTCGFAGGLIPDLKPGDVVFETGFPSSRSRGNEAQIGNRQPAIGNQSQPPHAGSCNLEEKFLAAGARPVRFCCADRVAVTAVEKKKLREQTGADAVEMESAVIHAVCAEQGIPCATVRVISDAADEDLPLDFNTLSKPDQSLDYRKLAWAVAKSPGKIGALLRLQKNTRFAAEQLARVLSATIRQGRVAARPENFGARPG